MPAILEDVGEDAKAKKQTARTETQKQPLLPPSAIQSVQEGGSEEAGSDASAPHSSDESGADDCKLHDGTVARHCAYTGAWSIRLCLNGMRSLAVNLQVT